MTPTTLPPRNVLRSIRSSLLSIMARQPSA
jgi:hypothetical protein